VRKRFRLSKLDELVKALDGEMREYVGTMLTVPTCKWLASSINSHFTDVEWEHVFQTLLQYAGQLLSPELSLMLSRQFAARVDELREGVLLKTEVPSHPAWILLEIINVDEALWKKDKKGVLLSLYCLTGQTAGVIIKKTVPEKWLAWLAYQIGFTRRITYDYDPRYLLFLRFWGHVIPLEGGKDLDFDEWNMDSNCLQSNKIKIKLRARLDFDIRSQDTTCKNGMDCYCWECPYTRLECDGATKGPLDVIRKLDKRATEASEPIGS
jgi:hypothetical protein